jgi:hypothetical protein
LFGSSNQASAAGESVVGNSGVLRADGEKLPTENEILVNEILHETDGVIAISLISDNGDEMEIKIIGDYCCHLKYFLHLLQQRTTTKAFSIKLVAD